MPEYVNFQLTHASMREAIDNNNVIVHQGDILQSHEELPLPESMSTDPKERKAIAKSIDEQILELEARRKALGGDGAEAFQLEQSEGQVSLSVDPDVIAQRQLEEERAKAEAVKAKVEADARAEADAQNGRKARS